MRLTSSNGWGWQVTESHRKGLNVPFSYVIPRLANLRDLHHLRDKR